MLLRLTLNITMVIVLIGCNKYPMPAGKTAYVPITMYITGENKDTTGATRYTFKYNSNNYLTGRDKYEGDQLKERFTVHYTMNSLIDHVIREVSGTTDTFFYKYNFTASQLEVKRSSADRRSGLVRTYTFIDPPAEENFLYPKSTLGRLRYITDSLYENGQYSRKLESAFGFGVPNRDNTEIVAARTESFPGVPNASTLFGLYTTTIFGYQNPFAFVSPDFNELPDELATPWPFIRKGFVLSYRLTAPSNATPELDTYEVAKSEARFKTPEQVRLTMTGRRSGQITVQYFIFEYEER